jgi:hypothetical protein
MLHTVVVETIGDERASNTVVEVTMFMEGNVIILIGKI